MLRVSVRSYVMVLAFCSAPGLALAPDSSDDIRCLIAAVSLIQSPNNIVRAAGASSALYFLGRLDGRDPGLDLEKIILAEAKKMDSATLRSESERCGRSISTRGRMISEMGQALQRNRNDRSKP
jgi:hypothetical protein